MARQLETFVSGGRYPATRGRMKPENMTCRLMAQENGWFRLRLDDSSHDDFWIEVQIPQEAFENAVCELHELIQQDDNNAY